jgi:hypothetical protein
VEVLRLVLGGRGREGAPGDEEQVANDAAHEVPFDLRSTAEPHRWVVPWIRRQRSKLARKYSIVNPKTLEGFSRVFLLDMTNPARQIFHDFIVYWGSSFIFSESTLC